MVMVGIVGRDEDIKNTMEHFVKYCCSLIFRVLIKHKITFTYSTLVFKKHEFLSICFTT